ncbi:MAG: hypothetical protein FJ029_05745 [Actinobacteria bacterium]|nr:hypothetical protein [Actinomycetota bacterium]
MRAYWLATPDWRARYGLPVAYVERGTSRVLRAQRAVLRQSGDSPVQLAPAGDHFKEARLIPPSAVVPVPPPAIPLPFLAGDTALVTGVEFSPSGTLLASGGWERDAVIWDRATGV